VDVCDPAAPNGDESVFQQPTPELLAAFVDGDPIAEDAVLRLVLPQLYHWALKHHPTLPPPEVQSVINQVAAETCRPHVRYDPARSRLTTYMLNLVSLRLNDLYATESRQKEHEEIGTDLRENFSQPPYNLANTPNPAAITRNDFFERVLQHLDGPERDFLTLMLHGEKREEVFIVALARYGPVPDPSREVKNAKVRLQRKLRKLADDMGYELQDFVDD
jgi:hypothetical protein